MRARPDSRGVVTVERVAVWLLAILAIAGLAALVVGPGADYRTAAPSVDIEGSYTATSGVVTLTHDGGDELTARSTTRLAVYVTDADTNATTRLTWANGSTLPLSEGATFAVDDPRVDSNGDQNFLDGDGSVGFSLADEDTVEVVWTGRLIGAPGERSTAFYTDTVGNMTN